MSNIVLVGDRVKFSFSFTELGATNPADPDVVTVMHRPPTGAEVAYTLSGNPTVVFKDSTGNYHAFIRVTMYRTHYFRATGTGGIFKSIEASIAVPEGAFDTVIT